MKRKSSANLVLVLSFLLLASCAHHQAKYERLTRFGQPDGPLPEQGEFDPAEPPPDDLDERASVDNGQVATDNHVASAPAPAPIPKSNHENYGGITGYFTRPPLFVRREDSGIYQRCAPFKVLGFSAAQGRTVLKIKQGKNTIGIYGLNRQPFKLSKNKRVLQMDKYFVKKLKISDTRTVASSSKVCGGTFWQKMSKKEFLFLSGDPDQVKVQKTPKGSSEQWIYKGAATGKPASYYFMQDHLWSWL